MNNVNNVSETDFELNSEYAASLRASNMNNVSAMDFFGLSSQYADLANNIHDENDGDSKKHFCYWQAMFCLGQAQFIATQELSADIADLYDVIARLADGKAS